MIRNESKFALSGMIAFIILTSCSSTAKKPTPSGPSPTPAATPIATFAASAKKSGTPLELKCSQEQDKRVIVASPTDQGCELHYTKFGETKVIARSTQGGEYCDQIQAKIRKNLESAGFTCK